MQIRPNFYKKWKNYDTKGSTCSRSSISRLISFSLEPSINFQKTKKKLKENVKFTVFYLFSSKRKHLVIKTNKNVGKCVDEKLTLRLRKFRFTGIQRMIIKAVLSEFELGKCTNFIKDPGKNCTAFFLIMLVQCAGQKNKASIFSWLWVSWCADNVVKSRT